MQLSAFPATSLRNAEKAPRAPKPLFGRATSTRAPPAKEAKRKGLEATPATRSRKAIRAPTAARPPPHPRIGEDRVQTLPRATSAAIKIKLNSAIFPSPSCSAPNAFG